MSWERLSSLVRYDVSGDGDVVTLRVTGELDVSSPQLAELIEGVGGHRRVALDMSRVSFIDAGGLSLLLLGVRRLRERGGELVVRRPHRAVRHLLQLCGDEVALPVEDAPSWLQPSPDVVAICARAIEEAISIGGATAGEVQLADSAGALHVVAALGTSQAVLDFFAVVDDTESACGAAWATGRAVYVSDAARSPIFFGTPSLDVVTDAGMRSGASIPLPGLQGQRVGILSIQRDHPGEWTRRQQGQLQGLADSTGRLLSAWFS